MLSCASFFSPLRLGTDIYKPHTNKRESARRGNVADTKKGSGIDEVDDILFEVEEPLKETPPAATEAATLAPAAPTEKPHAEEGRHQADVIEIEDVIEKAVEFMARTPIDVFIDGRLPESESEFTSSTALIRNLEALTSILGATPEANASREEAKKLTSSVRRRQSDLLSGLQPWLAKFDIWESDLIADPLLFSIFTDDELREFSQKLEEENERVETAAAGLDERRERITALRKIFEAEEMRRAEARQKDLEAIKAAAAGGKREEPPTTPAPPEEPKPKEPKIETTPPAAAPDALAETVIVEDILKEPPKPKEAKPAVEASPETPKHEPEASRTTKVVVPLPPPGKRREFSFADAAVAIGIALGVGIIAILLLPLIQRSFSPKHVPQPPVVAAKACYRVNWGVYPASNTTVSRWIPVGLPEKVVLTAKEYGEWKSGRPNVLSPRLDCRGADITHGLSACKNELRADKVEPIPSCT